MNPSNTDVIVDFSYLVEATDGWEFQLLRRDEGETVFVQEFNNTISGDVSSSFTLNDPPDGAFYILQIANADNNFNNGL
jgi:hypothetical protein